MGLDRFVDDWKGGFVAQVADLAGASDDCFRPA